MNVWTYWQGPRFPHIDTCLTSMARVCEVPGVDFHLVTPENLFNFIPKDTVHPNFFRLGMPNFSANYLRAILLAKYGGWWLDADTIGLSSPLGLVEKYPDAEMIYTCWPTPPKRILNGYIYARQNSLLAREWAKQVKHLLEHDFDAANLWLGMGEKILSPLLHGQHSCVEIDYRTFLPINIDQEVSSFFEPGDFRSHIKKHTIGYGLNHSWMLYHKRKEMSLAPQYWEQSPLLIHKLLHYANTTINSKKRTASFPTMVKKPKVSICMATYNRDPNVLHQVFDSIFQQTPPFEVEVIVCDDGSHRKDGSPDYSVQEISKQYPIQYHRINRPPGFKNPCVPRNVAYRAARGDIIIAQSDEVTHQSYNTIETLVNELEDHPKSFVIATVNACGPTGKPWSVYTGKKRQHPLFFLGALRREHLYAVGGNDEDFANGPGRDDVWFAQCLQKGLGLSPFFSDKATGHHLFHPPTSSKEVSKPNQEIERVKTVKAKQTKIWCASGGSWLYSDTTTQTPTRRTWDTDQMINSIVVCVDYDDFLSITLPLNKRHFHRTLVVTSPKDLRTQELARREGCECLVTDAFYANGAHFNKGIAIEQAFDALGRDGWLCYWDADTVMPEDIKHSYDPQFLYCPFRKVLNDPLQFNDKLDWNAIEERSPEPNEFPGYFHLFHASGAGPIPWYSIDWGHAGGCDSDFEQRYEVNQRACRPSYEVLHLGPVARTRLKGKHFQKKQPCIAALGKNWCGRVMPRIDTGEVPTQAKQRAMQVQFLTKKRHKTGAPFVIAEKIRTAKKPEAKNKIIAGNKIMVKDKVKAENIVEEKTTDPSLGIPRRMNFVWAGRMSWLRWLTLHTFCKLNPDWEVHLYAPNSKPIAKHWTMNTDDDHEYTGKDYREDIPSQVIRSEFSTPLPMASPQMCGWYRWQSLATVGGFFCDMDILWVKPLQTLWEKVNQADAVFCLESGYMAVGLIGSRPRCKLFQDMASSIKPKKTDLYQYYGVDYVYPFCGVRDRKRSKCPGKEALNRLRRHYGQFGRGATLNIREVPDYTVYPFDWLGVDSLWKQDLPINKKSLGVHWFGGNVISRKFSQQLTPENWKDHRNSLTNYLRKIL